MPPFSSSLTVLFLLLELASRERTSGISCGEGGKSYIPTGVASLGLES